jgi:polar amino acid transport system substrate-binding protein
MGGSGQWRVGSGGRPGRHGGGDDISQQSAGQSGAVDMVAHTMTIDCSRLKLVDFSTVYFDAGQRVLVEKGSLVRGIGDLGRQKVCATIGSTSIANIAAGPSLPSYRG